MNKPYDKLLKVFFHFSFISIGHLSFPDMVVLTDKALVNLPTEEAAVHAGHAVLVQSYDDGALIMILGAGNTKGEVSLYHWPPV